jgi:hypothetical protein
MSIPRRFGRVLLGLNLLLRTPKFGDELLKSGIGAKVF